MTTPRGSGLPAELDAHFHLLDRQIVDSENRMVAKVDDLELVERFDGPAVIAILTGPGALGPRLGGLLGEWIVAVWRRLHPEVDPQPGRIPIEEVTGLDNAVHVRHSGYELGVQGFERWADATVVSRLPLVHGRGPTGEPGEAAVPGLPGSRRLSQLIGQAVVAADGRRLGQVSDVRLRRDPIMDALVVTELLVNPRAVRSRFGYERPGAAQPAAVRFLLARGGSPAAGVVLWTEVDRIDWDQREVRCHGASLRPF